MIIDYFFLNIRTHNHKTACFSDEIEVEIVVVESRVIAIFVLFLNLFLKQTEFSDFGS